MQVITALKMNSKNNLRHNSISLSYLILAYLGLLFKDEDFFVSDASPRRGAPKLLATRQPPSDLQKRLTGGVTNI